MYYRDTGWLTNIRNAPRRRMAMLLTTQLTAVFVKNNSRQGKNFYFVKIQSFYALRAFRSNKFLTLRLWFTSLEASPFCSELRLSVYLSALAVSVNSICCGSPSWHHHHSAPSSVHRMPSPRAGFLCYVTARFAAFFVFFRNINKSSTGGVFTKSALPL